MIKRDSLKNYAVAFSLIFTTYMINAQKEPVFPIPQGNPRQLFYLQRTPNANTIVYELNYKNGELDSNEPVHAFWIRYGERGQRAELSSIQRSFAYGIRSKFLSRDNYELRFLSYKKAVMYLRKAPDKKYYVYVTINQKQAILYCIYLKISGGSFWSPNIEYAELKGTDPDTGTEVSERVKMKS